VSKATGRAGLSERGALARFRCHGERGAQAYKGGLGRSPKRSSRGHSPRWRARGLCRAGPRHGGARWAFVRQIRATKRSSGVITLHRWRKGSVVGGHHGEYGAGAYNGGLGAEPPAGSRSRAPGQGGRSPPEAETILVIGCPTEPANLARLQKCPFELRYMQQSLTENSMLCYGPLVSELGGGQIARCPQPRHGGLCLPPAPPPM